MGAYRPGSDIQDVRDDLVLMAFRNNIMRLLKKRSVGFSRQPIVGRVRSGVAQSPV
jgi:hypothetical protein